MGCAQSSRPSINSPPYGAEKMKMENGYVKGGHIRPRRSTGMRYDNGDHGNNRKAIFGDRENFKENNITNTKGENNGNFAERRNKAGEDIEIVDGWPKWLTDNIPRDVLRNIVPRSADSYVKIDKIGQGTYSNVYKARDKDTGKIVALKKKLDHPNILKLEGLATSRMQYSLYLVFDYMHSELSKILSRPDENLTEPQIKCYMQQLLSGLHHCHERSPELLLGSTNYGIGIDLWSAGCLMAEMFAGRPIMPGRTEVEQVHRIYKLCGSPPDDYYKRLKLSTALKPPQTYKSTLRETFRYFPSSSLDLLNKLLALDPARRGSASSALQHEFFHTSPLACDLSGLPVIHVEDGDEVLINDRRKHRTSRMRRRSQSQKEKRKKNVAAENPKGDAQGSKEDWHKNTETSIKPKEQSPTRLYTSPVVPIRKMSPRTEAHPNATKNIKNRPPLPSAKRRTTNYNMDGTNRFGPVRRSASSRDFRSLENNNLHALDD
ncbi:hypothetical protein DH2020_034799 [Rehmannia glutinosa]|uniref:Protein kinase domain-containing protein n=1 Tax=Rehmannia glutinosa TaxID=99300 RepID=A0ABR0V951_REHGL